MMMGTIFYQYVNHLDEFNRGFGPLAMLLDRYTWQF